MPLSDDDFKPAAVRELFDTEGDLTLKTETPPKMILPLVRLRILSAAANPHRHTTLIEEFVGEFDRRMISVSRKGRLELLAAMQASSAFEGEEEGSI